MRVIPKKLDKWLTRKIIVRSIRKTMRKRNVDKNIVDKMVLDMSNFIERWLNELVP